MNFFGRKRRESSEGKGFGTYVTYALGEIFLVVVGILLAIEINNWNEARNNRESEQALLKGLVKEMTANRDELAKAMSYHKRSEDAASQLVKIYQGDYRNYSTHKLDSILAEVQWAWTFDPRLGVLNSIKTTGKINIIQNPHIQSFITSFEEVANDSREEALTIKTLILTQFMPIVNQYISVNQRVKYLGVKMGESKFPPDYKSLFNDRAGESIIAYILFWRIDERSEEEDVLKQIDEAISLVESEIGNEGKSEK